MLGDDVCNTCALILLVTVIGKYVPPFKDPSLAEIITNWPQMAPMPHTVPAPGIFPYSKPSPAVGQIWNLK